MKRSTDRILTIHVGGLRRPDDLMHMLAARDAGQAYDRAALAQRVRSATTDIVHEQGAAGIDVVNDGEFPKISWMGYFHDRLTGIEWRQPEGTYTPFFTGRDTDQFPAGSRLLCAAVAPRTVTCCKSNRARRRWAWSSARRSAGGHSSTLVTPRSSLISAT
jgi:hypothetical protein